MCRKNGKNPFVSINDVVTCMRIDTRAILPTYNYRMKMRANDIPQTIDQRKNKMQQNIPTMDWTESTPTECKRA